MNILLKPYQETAVERCLKGISRSAEDWDDSKQTSAVSLAAFTSAGKTIIATALIERLRFGDGAEMRANPDFTVLWVTNSPSLNEQTTKKMESTSRLKRDEDLVEIDENLTGSALTPGKVYFLNTQKLAKTASKYRQSESRPVSLEQMIRNTVNHLGTNFLMVIDEAHIGTRKDERGGQPIAYRLMNGADGAGMFPIVLGISATPQRFLDGIKGTGRATHTVEVPVKDIRESGLIKDRLLAHVPTDGEYVESKLLKQAVDKWAESDAAWDALHQSDKQNFAAVKPLLLIPVEPGISGQRIGEILADLRKHDERLDGAAVTHSFGEKTDITLGSDRLRHILPEDIQETSYVRAVLFKDALTTGWDCPRAEVLISLRSANEPTYVKQMIGRMVRTPLAEKIEGHPFLNDVTMYLPHYNLDTIEQVRKDLQGDTDDSLATEVVTRPVDLRLVDVILGAKKAGVLVEDDTVINRMRLIKSHKRPRRRRGPVPRLGELARLLESTNVLKGAEKSADRALAAVMLETYEADKDRIDDLALGSAATKVAVVDIGDGLGGVKDVKSGDLVTEYTVDGLPTGAEAQRRFEEAKRACGAGVALEQVWQEAAGEDPTAARFNDSDAHVEAQLIATEIGLIEGVRDIVNTAAEAKFDSWVKAHGGKLQFAAKAAYVELMAAAGVSIPVELTWPAVLHGERDSDILAPDGHIYVRTDGQYPLPKPLNPWESETVAAMAALPGFVGWWRNPTGGDNALGVRYASTTGEERTLYPDFLGVYRDGDHVRFVVFDPHENYFDGQSRKKWLGLAEYLRADYNVDDNGDRIIDTAWAIIRPTQEAALQAIDLGDDEVVEMLQDANIDLASQVFATKGFALA